MNVRKAASADLDAVLAIHLAGPAVADQPRRQYLTDAIRNGGCLLACEGTGTAGFAVWDRGFFGYPFVPLLIVRPDASRRGTATALLHHIEAACQADHVFTSTNESNAPMRALCAAVGYQPSGRIDNPDDGDPELMYCKRVVPRPTDGQ